MGLEQEVARELAGALGTRDFAPNAELAARIVAAADERAVRALAELVAGGTRRQARDAVHALFEVARAAPELVVELLPELIDWLESPQHNVVWGALCALEAVTPLAPDAVRAELPLVLNAAARSGVIAKGSALGVLTTLAGRAEMYAEVAPVLLDFVQATPLNQFPTYADRAAACLRPAERAELAEIVRGRDDVRVYPAKARKLAKLLRELEG